ncbi:MAG TPA: alpha/beta hydrolase-fold protein [Gemmataceae bacterium]|nr:alpha/beta hydrolase-fold protein [Gemmataceae bacterium]
MNLKTQITPLAMLLALALGIISLATGSTALGQGKDPAKDILADGNVKIGPTYTAAPETKVRNDVPKGKMTSFTMDRKDSKFFPIDPKLKNNPTRKVSVYVPNQYVPGTEAAFAVIQDASYIKVLPTILDNMIHDKRLPVIIPIFVANGGSDSKGSERGLEYDTLSGKYAEFIEAEVLPEVEKQAGVKLTKDPEGRSTMGGSSGGLCAFTMAWYHPEWYHRVLIYSGTFVNTQSPVNPQTPHGGWEYHENIIPKSEKKPIRIWLEVGENDNGAKSPASGFRNWVIANNNMADVLKAKGYHYRYVFALNAGHTAGNVTNQTLPEALLYVWQGYPIAAAKKK